MSNSGKPKFAVWDLVRKWTGEAHYEGIVVCVYYTTKGHLRYVVEVMPQGFQMIAHESTLELVTFKNMITYESSRCTLEEAVAVKNEFDGLFPKGRASLVQSHDMWRVVMTREDVPNPGLKREDGNYADERAKS